VYKEVVETTWKAIKSGIDDVVMVLEHVTVETKEVVLQCLSG